MSLKTQIIEKIGQEITEKIAQHLFNHKEELTDPQTAAKIKSEFDFKISVDAVAHIEVAGLKFDIDFHYPPEALSETAGQSA
jgi:hypothetical protein